MNPLQEERRGRPRLCGEHDVHLGARPLGRRLLRRQRAQVPRQLEGSRLYRCVHETGAPLIPLPHLICHKLSFAFFYFFLHDRRFLLFTVAPSSAPLALKSSALVTLLSLILLTLFK